VNQGKSTNQIAITVPNYATLAEENALKNAAKIAGFNTVNIVSEAVALALSYGFFRRKDMFKKES